MIGVSHLHPTWNTERIYLFESNPNDQTNCRTELYYRTGTSFLGGAFLGIVWGLLDGISCKEADYTKGQRQTSSE